MPFLIEKKHRGFTLTEVIIVLLMIGIVAALVIPQVNMAYQRATLRAQFLKVYNTLSRAVQISSMTNSEIGTWTMDINNSDIIISDYIKPFIHVAGEKPIQPYSLRDLKVKSLGALNNFISSRQGGGTIQYFLNDGSSIMVSEINNEGAVILVDTNGEKTPNIIGRDVFFLLLRKADNQVAPKTPQGEHNANCGGVPESGVLAGEGCAARILKEGKMNY